MNFFVLDVGDVIYILVDGIYVYLSGDIVECMVCSNNVFNVGFCFLVDCNNIDMFVDMFIFKLSMRLKDSVILLL